MIKQILFFLPFIFYVHNPVKCLPWGDLALHIDSGRSYIPCSLYTVGNPWFLILFFSKTKTIHVVLVNWWCSSALFKRRGVAKISSLRWFLYLEKHKKSTKVGIQGMLLQTWPKKTSHSCSTGSPRFTRFLCVRAKRISRKVNNQ